MHVSICALTYLRPHGLGSLLAALNHLNVPEGVEITVVVVDNDEQRSGESIVESARATLIFPIHYRVEERRGISPARNTAVETALSCKADFVAFIDDDEVPDANWLSELLKIQESENADVVTGPVLTKFVEPPPAWVEKGGFFNRPRFPTATRINYARTSNVLVASKWLSDPWPPFDERYAMTGGEDTHFFMRIRLDGAHIVWADEAIVAEEVPSSRISTSWILRRAYRRGNTLSTCLLDLQDSWPRRAKRVGAATYEVLGGLALLVVGPFRGKAAMITALQKMAYGAGLASGLVGMTYKEYTKTHGH